MRIAVLSMYNGVVHRGVEAWAAELCHHLSAMGHECALIQGGPLLDTLSTTPAAMYQTISVRYIRPDRSDDIIAGQFQRRLHRHGLDIRTRELCGFAIRCLPALRRFRPDVVIPANGQLSIAAAALYRHLINPCARVVVAAHAGFDEIIRHAQQRGADGLVALSPPVRALMNEHATIPSRVIPNGVDWERFRAARPVPLDLLRPIVLSTAALIGVKRLHLAIEAVAETNLSLLLLGDGSKQEELVTLGNRLLGPGRFAHHPAVPPSDVPGYFAAADVYTLPTSPAESFGIAIIEALASGIPTVVTNDRIRRWMVGDAGVLVNPENRAAYAAALQQAAMMPRAQGLACMRERFDWPSVARMWIDFFDELRAIPDKKDLRRENVRRGDIHKPSIGVGIGCSCGQRGRADEYRPYGYLPYEDHPDHGRCDDGHRSRGGDVRGEAASRLRPTISAVILARNEADLLDICLQSVSPWVDDLVVVDLASTDRTAEIARHHGARIFAHEPLDFVEPARNFAFAQARGEWVLALDPDERVPSALAAELRRLAYCPDIDVVQVPRQHIQFGRRVQSAGASDQHQPRFFRSGVLSWPAYVHGLPELEGLGIHTILSAPGMSIEHDTWRSVPIVLDKIQRYAPHDVENIQATGKHFSLLGMLRAVHNQVAGRLVDGQAYEDGMAGLLTALFYGAYHFVIYAELWEADGKPPQSDATVIRWGKRLAPFYRATRWCARATYRVVRLVRPTGA